MTGAARGIGAGIARRVARAGADVSIFDTRPGTAEETAAQVRDSGGEAAIFDVDVSSEAAIADGLDGAVSELGPIGGLVNNAGVQRAIPILETTEEDWDFHMNVNAKGTFLVSKAVAGHMVDEGTNGAIVNVASTAAVRAFPGQGAYAASKAGVVAFTKVLAKELGDHGITANAINPGTVDTPMVQEWLEEHAAESDRAEAEVLDDALESHTLDRMGRPEEIGHVAVLLLSKEGEWITGEAINVDAGYTSE
ncbi:NAD(P)-dependent oxidoreductase [Halobacteriales archaeon QS_8_69_26]|nr:MAG: NAD(P)-dependent oxidoreductase [Halobacteriales archaeon QS_8_69_26]